ncbi:ADP-ribosyltransferase-containing protein [Geopseudomonas aromaticivorans]
MIKSTLARIIDAYHGSGTKIDQFSYEFTGIGNDQNGSGFYFSTDINDAIGYCTGTLNGQPKPGGMETPTVHHVRLHLENPLDCQTTGELTRAQARNFIERAPNLDDALSNWGDVDHEGREAVIRRAVSAYTPNDSADGEPARLLRWLHSMANDFYPEDVEAFNRSVQAILGYDSVVERFEKNGKAHYVAFFPEQVEILEHIPLASLCEPEATLDPAPNL